MKTYLTILLGVVVIAAVVFGGYKYTKSNVARTSPVGNDGISYVTTSGEVTRIFEGTSTLSYTFDIRTTATTSVSMNGALIKVTNGTSTTGSMYISYEGGRGYSPVEYITNIVSPHLPSITLTGTSTIGAYDWVTAETPASEWFIASVANGKWLIIMEGKKASDSDVKHLLETIRLESNK